MFAGHLIANFGDSHGLRMVRAWIAPGLRLDILGHPPYLEAITALNKAAMTVFLDTAQETETPEQSDLEPRRRTDAKSMVAMRFDLRWQSDKATHLDRYHAQKLDLWRDLIPPELEPQLMNQPVGHRAEHSFAPGELIAPHSRSLELKLRHKQFNQHFMRRGAVQPRNGRFYPRGVLRKVDGVFESDRTPFRVVSCDGADLHVDLNHPLADRTLTLSARLESIWTAGDNHGGRCNEIHELITANAPGMQARYAGTPTDFWSDLPFVRTDPSPDAGFYGQPRFVDHIDSTAIASIRSLYGELIPKGARILDLMTSWHSHLPDSLQPTSVTGLGMNQAELDQNPVLTERLLYDLNQEPTLPFATAGFDAIVCTASVEYLTRPFEVFRELGRVLKPGGKLIITFSNRWFPSKAIQIWEGIHEFERTGMVLEYFHDSPLFTDLNSFSQRGLPRPKDDKYADRVALSDPVHAVWGTRGSDDPIQPKSGS